MEETLAMLGCLIGHVIVGPNYRFYFDPQEWGKGYATEALNLTITKWQKHGFCTKFVQIIMKQIIVQHEFLKN